MSKLVQLFTEGVLGPIAIGDSMDVIRDRLGPPQDVSVCKDPEIWKYGALQLSFDARAEDGARLHFIGIYYRNPKERLPDMVTPEDYLPTRTTRPDELRKYFAAHGLLLETIPLLTFETQLGFGVGKGDIIFDRELPGDPIDSIQVLWDLPRNCDPS